MNHAPVLNTQKAKNFFPFSFASVFVILLILDQVSKAWILQHLNLHESIEIIPDFFHLTLVMNKGVAFGMGSNLEDSIRPYLLWGAMALALLVLFYLLINDFRGQKLPQLAIAGIFAGAIGNAIDRFRFGAVVDFFDFFVQGYHWPAFNVADSAICVGVFLLLAHGWIFARRSECPAPEV
jgi:signal peptidase II